MKRPSSTLFMACFLVAASVLASETTTIDDWLDMAFYPGCEPKDSRGIAATLQTQFGMTPAAIRERCLSVALDETADTPKRAGAVRFLCEVFPAPERGDLTPFFVHEKVQLRNVAVLSCFESASNVIEKLHFAEVLFGRAATNALFLPAASVVSRRFGQMLRYAPLAVQDRNTILSTFARMTQEFDQPELLRLSEDIVVRFNSCRPPEEVIPNTGNTEPLETDSSAEGAEQIVPSEDNLLTGPSRSRLAWIVGAVALLAIAFALAVRRRHQRPSINEGRQPAE